MGRAGNKGKRKNKQDKLFKGKNLFPKQEKGCKKIKYQQECMHACMCMSNRYNVHIIATSSN